MRGVIPTFHEAASGLLFFMSNPPINPRGLRIQLLYPKPTSPFSPPMVFLPIFLENVWISVPAPHFSCLFSPSWALYSAFELEGWDDGCTMKNVHHTSSIPPFTPSLLPLLTTPNIFHHDWFPSQICIHLWVRLCSIFKAEWAIWNAHRNRSSTVYRLCLLLWLLQASF